LADPSAPLILAALQRAAVEPDGLALWSSKSAPGLFAASAAGKQAAQRCKDAGLLRVVRTEAKGKTPREICALTEPGLHHLLEQTSPRPVLEALLQAIQRCETKLADLIANADQQRLHLETLKALSAKLLQQSGKTGAVSLPWETNGKRPVEEYVLESLRGWHGTRQLGDCPLPELHRRVKDLSPKLTLGQFHDAVRLLHEQQSVFLHPWTGPLYEMPEPAVALLSGHEIAYYVSLRDAPV
jgi:hypothetical protein